MLMAKPPMPPQIKHSRSLDFGTGLAGWVYVRNWGSSLSTAWDLVGKLQGKVEIPPGKEVRLKITLETTGLDWLAKLAPHDLQAVEIIGLQRPAEQLIYLTPFSYLRSLYFNSEQVEGKSLPPLHGLTQIEELLLPNGQLNDADLAFLAKFENIKSLDLSFTAVSGSFLDYLPNPSLLKTLSLVATSVNHESLGALAKSSDLETLMLDDNELDDRILERLSDLVQLKSLFLGGNATSDEIGFYLPNFAGLEELDLSRTDITDATFKAIASLKHLKHLNVMFTGVTNRGIGCLKGHKALEVIEAQESGVNSAAERYTLKMTNLRKFEYGELTRQSLDG
jgi:hypothetical protein